MISNKRLITLFVLFSFLKSVSFAQISLPKMFGNNMVLQRGISIPIWGSAATNAIIVAQLGKEQTITQADGTGKWQLHFKKLPAGGPYILNISEQGKPDSKLELNNILIGDVWVASGQSNMEWQVSQAKDAKTEIANADYPKIRFLSVEHDIKLAPQADIKTKGWKLCDTNTIKDFSAVAYFFARKIHQDENVPIGIIQSTWGGTPIQSWTSKEMLQSSFITKNAVLANDTLSSHDFLKDSADLNRFWEIVLYPQNNADKIIPLTGYDDASWNSVEMPKVRKDFGIGNYEGIMWLRKKMVLPESFTAKDLTLSLGHPEMNYSLYFNGTEICKTVWNANINHSYTIPKNLVKNGENVVTLRMAMLWGGGGLNAPAEDIFITDGSAKIPLTGKWRYSIAIEPAIPKIHNYQNYSTVLFNAMINPLIPYGIRGFIWYQGEANDSDAYNYRKMFPMMITDWRQRWQGGNLPFLFVQLAGFKKRAAYPTESEWAELREAQAMTLSQPNTAMACAIDVGDADNIHPTNKQEVGRRLALGAEKLVYNSHIISSGPLYKNYKVEGSRIRIKFTNTGSGLITKDRKAVAGFSIAGADKQFYWAEGVIDGDEIVVYSDKVHQPIAVRYAWADNPECNLINKENLPAIPFRTDAWKGITQKETGSK